MAIIPFIMSSQLAMKEDDKIWSDNCDDESSSQASQIQQHPVIRGRRKRLPDLYDLRFDETIKASDYEPVNDYFAVTHPAAARKDSMLGSYNHLNN